MRSIFSITLVLAFHHILFAQDLVLSEGQTYKNSKITLASGSVVKASRFTVKDSTLIFPTGGSGATNAILLKDIEQIHVATKNHWAVGALAGTAVGVVAMLVVKSSFEKPETSTISGPGFTQTTTTQKIMATGPKVLIVAGGVGVGALIGSLIKGGWKKIYPNEKLSHKVSLGLSFSNQIDDGLVLSMRLRL